MDLAFETHDVEDPVLTDAIVAGLNEHSATHGVTFGKRPLCVSVRDAQGTLVGGLTGHTLGDWLYIRLLWVSLAARGHEVGTRLLRAAEHDAMERGCVGAYVDTFSFQAQGFYEKQGYGVFGSLTPFWGEHTRVYLKKTLPPQRASTVTATPT